MHITINGKQVGIKFNNWGMDVFQKLQAQWAEKGVNEDNVQLYGYTWAGVQGWKFRVENAPGSTFIAPDISFEDVCDWVDQAADNDEIFKQVSEIRALLLDAPLMKKALQILADKEKKSELTGETMTETGTLAT